MGAATEPRDWPVGCRFHPTEEEAVNHYLNRRVQGYVDHPCIIPDVDICSCDPWELQHKFHGRPFVSWDDRAQEWWFFSQQTPHSSQKVRRLTPYGYWKKTGTSLDVKDRYTGTKIGTKKILVFHQGRGKNGVKTNWVIHEYHLFKYDSDTHVLCRLKLKRDKKANDSTKESEGRAFADFELDSDLNEASVQPGINSLRELTQPENQLQPALGSQNNSLPSDIHQLTDTEGPSGMDKSIENGLPYDHNQLLRGTSEEDGYFDYVGFLNRHIETVYGQTSSWHNEQNVLMNRQAQTTDSVHGFFSLELKKVIVETKFDGSPFASEKPKPRPVPYTAPHRPRAPPVRHAAIYSKPECISLDETAARVKVLGYKERGSATNSTKKTNSKEFEHTKEKANLVAASTGTTSESTKTSTNPPLANLVNVLVGIFLLLTITRLVLNF